MSDKKYYLENDIYQLWLFAGEDTAKVLEEKYPNIKAVSWRSNGYDIIPKDVSKMSAIMTIKDLYKNEEHKIYCFGDGHNDIEMIEFADYGVAMGNAVQELKDRADYITTNVSNDGIMNAIAHFGLI